MKQKNRRLLFAEICLIILFLAALFLFEQASIRHWVQGSMGRSVENLGRILEESAQNGEHDRDEQKEVMKKIALLAAYFFQKEEDTAFTDEMLRELLPVFGARGIYLTDRDGKLLAGSDRREGRAGFQDAYYSGLLEVSSEEPASELLPEWGEPGFSMDDIVDESSLAEYTSAYLDEERIVILLRPVQYYKLDAAEQLSSSWLSIVKESTYGNHGFFLVASTDGEVLIVPDAYQEAHPSCFDERIPARALHSGFSGQLILDGYPYYCRTTYYGQTESYLICMLPARELLSIIVFILAGTVTAVLSVFHLMRFYTRMLLVENEKREGDRNAVRAFRKHLLTSLLLGMVCTIAIHLFSNVLFFYTERIKASYRTAALLAETTRNFEEKQARDSGIYYDYAEINTRVAARLLGDMPELCATDKLEEMADRMGAAIILVYDKAGVVTASNMNFDGLTLSEDPDSLSYQFHWVLRGGEPLVQDSVDEDFLARPYQFSGAPVTDREGDYTGMVQIGLDPAVYQNMESAISLQVIMSNTVLDDNSEVLAVDSETGLVSSPNPAYDGLTAGDLNLDEGSTLEDDFTGFYRLKLKKMLGCCKDNERYHILAGSVRSGLTARGTAYGLFTVVPCLIAELLFFFLLLAYAGSARKLPKKEILTLNKNPGNALEKAMMTGAGMIRFTNRVIFGISAIISFAYLFGATLFQPGSLGYYIFVNEWDRGIYIFTVTRCLTYILTAFFILSFVTLLFTLLGSLLSPRQETIIRMAMSCMKYATVLGTIVICAGLLGARTASVLASAGVISVVVSFGAQTFLADIIAGLFIIFEGTFKVGDMITVDNWHGRVVEINIRNTKIRDLIEENDKVINNSMIRTLINYSDTPSWCRTTIGIDYDQDVREVEAIFEREKAAMRRNIPHAIGEISYLGIEELAESCLVLRFQVHCRNQDEPAVRRALNRELKLMFDRNGISVPFPQVVVSPRQNPEKGRPEKGRPEKGRPEKAGQ